jgi:hypothetical protein
MPKEPRPLPTIVARLEIDDDNPVRKTIELSPAERAALEAEKAQMLREIAGPRTDDGPRARRLGRVKPDVIPDPDFAGEPEPDRAPAPIAFDDDEPFNRPKIELSDAEVARLEEERRQLVASIRATRAVEAEDLEEVADRDLSIPDSPELDAAAAALAEVEAEVNALEAERKASEKARVEEQKAREAEHQAKLALLQAKRDAADAEKQKALQAQAAASLKIRAEKSRRAADEELARQARILADRAAALRERVEPVIAANERELAELQEFANANMKTLRTLSGQSWKNCPATWPGELRAEFQKEVVGRATTLLRDLTLSLDSYPRHIFTLKDIASGRGAHDEQTIVQALYDASIARPGTGDGFASSCRRDLARLNEVAEDVFDRGRYAEELGVVHAVEPTYTLPARRNAEAAQAAEFGVGVGQQAMADIGPSPTASTEELSPEEERAARERMIARTQGAVRDY